MTQRTAKRRSLRERLTYATGCTIQYTGWPCNTCFHALKIGLDADDLDRAWHATLVLRGDYRNGDYGMEPFTDQELTHCIDRLIWLLRACPAGRELVH